METLLLIDGNALMHRAFFALPPLNSRLGIPTNLIYGFFMMVYKATTDFKPNYVIICFDTPKPTFRKELSKTYQAHRPKVADGFKEQVPYVKQLLDEAGIARMEKEGFEADDVIGTLATKYKETLRVLILTGDKDIMQLVDNNVYVITPKVGITTTMLYDINEVRNKLGVEPSKIPDYKALAGDPSDNYPGAKGIGPKTASKLVNEFQNVENLLQNIESLPEGRVKNLVKEHIEDIKLSKTLATIVTNVDIDVPLDIAKFSGFNKKMRTTLQNLDLHTLATKLFSSPVIYIEKQTIKAIKEETKEVEDPQLDLF